jgi:acyl-CoA thioester hydrolase
MPAFELDFDVRDYECDMEGIVNNAVYLNYLEHTRHVFLKKNGLDFAELTGRGIHLVVIRLEIDYLWPLRSGDSFTVSLRPERLSPLRFCFHQQIRRKPAGKPILRAKVVGTAINERGRPFMPEEVERLWGLSPA